MGCLSLAAPSGAPGARRKPNATDCGEVARGAGHRGSGAGHRGSRGNRRLKAGALVLRDTGHEVIF